MTNWAARHLEQSLPAGGHNMVRVAVDVVQGGFRRRRVQGKPDDEHAAGAWAGGSDGPAVPRDHASGDPEADAWPPGACPAALPA